MKRRPDNYRRVPRIAIEGEKALRAAVAEVVAEHKRTGIEYPVYRDSVHSYFIQAVDLAAFLLYQHLAPNVYMREKGGKNYFNRLGPILCRVATSLDPDGIGRL